MYSYILYLRQLTCPPVQPREDENTQIFDGKMLTVHHGTLEALSYSMVPFLLFFSNWRFWRVHLSKVQALHGCIRRKQTVHLEIVTVPQFRNNFYIIRLIWCCKCGCRPGERGAPPTPAPPAVFPYLFHADRSPWFGNGLFPELGSHTEPLASPVYVELTHLDQEYYSSYGTSKSIVRKSASSETNLG